MESVISCEEVLKKNMERHPGSFELLAGNLRYNVSVDPYFSFRININYCFKLKTTSKKNQFLFFFCSWLVLLFGFASFWFSFLFVCFRFFFSLFAFLFSPSGGELF